MATIGQPLTAPEAGWQRIQSSQSSIVYAGSGWTTGTNAADSGGSFLWSSTGATKITLKFRGTKLRIISRSDPSHAPDLTIKIDGVSETFSQRPVSGTAIIFQALQYEKLGLADTIHTVEISTNTVNVNTLDAIDIDSTGSMQAQVGQTLGTPDAGWKRYDAPHPSMKIVQNGGVLTDAAKYGGSYIWINEGSIRFDFIGTELRLISGYWSNKSTDVKVTIDGVTESHSQYSTATDKANQILVYEKTGLANVRHTVVISETGTNDAALDAIDINSSGRLLHSDEVTDLYDLAIGKRIRLNYKSATSGAYGTFINIGQETNGFIPATSSATPDGDFYLICVDTERWSGRKKLIADRNIQHSIPWDVLNTAGLVGNLPIVLDYTDTLIPQMVSNNAPSGVAFASNWYSDATLDLAPYKAFNRAILNTNDAFENANTPNPHWLGYQFPIAKVIKKFTLSAGNGGAPERMPKNFTFQGSNDGTNWVVLATFTGYTFIANEKKTFYVANNGSFTYYRIHLTANNSAPNPSIYRIYEFEMMSEVGSPAFNYTNRLLTGGVSTTDTDNEWDRYIVNGTGNGTYTAGDNAVWNWDVGVATLASSTPSGFPSSRAWRGDDNGTNPITYYAYNSTANSYTTVAFRPVMIIEANFFVASQDLLASITINSRYKNLGGNQRGYDIDSSIKIRERNDLVSSISVLLSGTLVGKVTVTGVTLSDIASSIIIKTPSDITSSITILCYGSLVGLVDVQPPPIITTPVGPGDAFVRSQVPRLNYGTVGDLLVGYDPVQNENFRSFMSFDLSFIPQGMKIKNAKLKIFSDAENLPTSQLVISQLNDSFTEKGITWANQPSPSTDIATVTIGESKGYFEVDLLTIVQQWYNGSAPNNGIVIKPVDETFPQVYRMYAREQTSNRPTLVVDYIDPAVKSIGISQYPGTIVVRQNKTKDINGSINIKSSWDRSQIDGSIHVQNFNYMLESSIIVSKPDMPSSITARLSVIDDRFTGSITIRQYGLPSEGGDFDSSIFINGIYLKGSTTVRKSDIKEVSCSIAIRTSEKSQIDGSISISRPNILGSIRVFQINSIDGSIDVRFRSDLSSTISARRSDQRDLSGSLKVMKNEDFASQIFILSGYLKSSISIPYKVASDMHSYGRIQTFFVKDLVSSILIGESSTNNNNGMYVFIM